MASNDVSTGPVIGGLHWESRVPEGRLALRWTLFYREGRGFMCFSSAQLKALHASKAISEALATFSVTELWMIELDVGELHFLLSHLQPQPTTSPD